MTALPAATRGRTGYWRTPELLQRGNGEVQLVLAWRPADARRGRDHRRAPRLDPATAPTLPRIPAAVLSWGEARKHSGTLDDGRAIPAFPEARCRSRITLGDGGVRVQIARRDGRTRSRDDPRRRRALCRARATADRGVLLGTHHDAWTFGGVDPGTGTAAMLEVARGLGALAARRAGSRSATITIAFWDAEEFGLIGSTEYAEERAAGAARRHGLLHQHRPVHATAASMPAASRRCVMCSST